MTRSALETLAAVRAESANPTLPREPGWCLKDCRIMADVGPKYTTAYLSGLHANCQPGPPGPGQFVYWSNPPDSGTAGHIAIADGEGGCYSTDIIFDGEGGPGLFTPCPIGWIRERWGLLYMGASYVINDIEIPHDQDESQGGGEPIPPEDLDMTIEELDAYLRDPARSALRGVGPQMRVTQILGKPEQYAWNGFRFEHIYSQDRKNGLMATGALAAMPIDMATEAQFDQAVQHTREHGTFELCGCSSPTCRLKAA